MRRLILIALIVLLFPLIIKAQKETVRVVYVTGVPSLASCMSGRLYVNALTGDIYSYKIGLGCIISGNVASLTGTGVVNRIGYWNGTSSLSSTSGFTFSSNNLSIPSGGQFQINGSQIAFSNLAGNIAVSQMNSGTSASSSTYWRGDGTWASISVSPGGSDTQLQYNNAGAFGGISGATTNGTATTFSSANLIATRPRFITSIDDTNGNELFKVGATASAVNEFTFTNATTTNAPVLSTTGDDTNIGLTITAKGTGRVLIKPTGAPSTFFEVQDSSSNGFFRVTSTDVQVRNNILDLIGAGNNLSIVVGSGRIIVSNSGSIEFRASSGGAIDTALMRGAAGLAESNNGTIGSYRDFKVRQHYIDATITAAGTTGNQTINKAAGTVNLVAGASSITVTSNLVTANSLIFLTTRTNDATCSHKNVVASAGAFTINMTATCTAETSVGFIVVNQ